MIKTVKHKGLKKFWENSDKSGLNAAWVKKITLLTDALDAANDPDQMDIPGFGFHPLKGNRRGTYSLSITGNWRLTFKFEGINAIDVNIEDYH